MQLEGWANPLPDYIVKAIEAGTIVVKQARDYQYLVGETTYPHSKCVVSFKG